MFIHTCTYIYIYIHIHVQTYIYKHTRTHAHTCIYVYRIPPNIDVFIEACNSQLDLQNEPPEFGVSTLRCIYIQYIYIYIYIYICIHIYMCVYPHTCITCTNKNEVNPLHLEGQGESPHFLRGAAIQSELVLCYVTTRRLRAPPHPLHLQTQERVSSQ